MGHAIGIDPGESHNDLKAERNTMRKKMLYQSAVAAAIGLIASLMFCLIEDWEAVGLVVVLAPLFLVSVVLVFLLEAASASRVLKYAAFASPLAFLLGATFYAMWGDGRGTKDPDGSGSLALFTLEAYLVGLIIAYICLIALDRKASTSIGEGVEKVTEQSFGDEKDSHN